MRNEERGTSDETITRQGGITMRNGISDRGHPRAGAQKIVLSNEACIASPAVRSASS